MMMIDYIGVISTLALGFGILLWVFIHILDLIALIFRKKNKEVTRDDLTQQEFDELDVLMVQGAISPLHRIHLEEKMKEHIQKKNSKYEFKIKITDKFYIDREGLLVCSYLCMVPFFIVMLFVILMYVITGK
jgi:hypothetical protein